MISVNLNSRFLTQQEEGTGILPELPSLGLSPRLLFPVSLISHRTPPWCSKKPEAWQGRGKISWVMRTLHLIPHYLVLMMHTQVFTSMVQNILKPLKKPIKRYNISFVHKKTNLDSIIGRTAHILFLDNHLYMVMMCHIYRELFE